MAKRRYSAEEARQILMESDSEGGSGGSEHETDEDDPDYDVEGELRHGDDVNIDRHERDANFSSDSEHSEQEGENTRGGRTRGRTRGRGRARTRGGRARGRVRTRGGSARGRVRMRGGRMAGGDAHAHAHDAHDAHVSDDSDDSGNYVQVQQGGGDGPGDEPGDAARADDEDESAAGSDDQSGNSDVDDDDPVEWQMPELNWQNTQDFQPDDHAFTGASGIQVDTEGFKPVDYFKLFMTDDLVNHLVVQTNLYAEQYIADHPNLPPHSNVREWHFTNPREMRQFIGLVLLMGIDKRPRIDLYWSKDPLYFTPIYGQTMKRIRFRLLLRFLHFNDNRQQPDPRDPDRDRLFKLRPLIDHLFEHFQIAYTPTRNVAVDESLVLWKGRLLFRQYIPMKRARFGIKIYCLCEESGYMYRFHVYCGKSDPFDQMEEILPDEVHHFLKSEKVVLYLMHPLLNKGYCVFMDNFYTSCRLFRYLHDRQTIACGTLRSNRVPDPVKHAQVPQDGLVAMEAGPLLCLKFKDKKFIHVLTTAHDNSVQNVAIRGRRQRGGPPQRRTKPSAVIQYNKSMGGVDKQDQVRSYIFENYNNNKYYIYCYNVILLL